MGDKTREEARALLQSAFDNGIRHFDVARAYGYGDAERVLGEWAQSRRDQITITTKFGMQPMQAVSQAKGAVQIIRRLMRLSPFIRKFVRRKVATLIQTRQFGVETARQSLDTSLRALQTDAIDIYLLHETEPDDCRDDLREFLEAARDAGKIRCFGVGTAFPRAEQICREHPQFTQVAQFESSVLQQPTHAQRIAELGAPARIIHGAFAALAPLLALLETDAAFAQWFDAIGNVAGNTPNSGQSREQTMAGLLLAHAVQDNQDGVVVFRASRPERIAANIAAMRHAQAFLTPEQTARFAMFAAHAKIMPV